MPLCLEMSTSLPLTTLAEAPMPSVELTRSAKVWRVSPAWIATLLVVVPVVMSSDWPVVSVGVPAEAIVWAWASAVTTRL